MSESITEQEIGTPPPGPGVILPPEVQAHLLDPLVWREALKPYALTTHLAVALADADGRLLGGYINPQSVWRLLYARQLAGAGSCPFSLAPFGPCTCIADALATDGLRFVRDRSGLVHFAVPLVLGKQALGALVAGQVFDQYPDQAMLEQVALKLGARPQEVWQRARLEPPIKRATLWVYADLLATLGQTFLQERHHTLVEANRLTEMTRLRDQLGQRSEELSAADHRKDEFLAMLAHELRNPLAPIRHAIQILRLTDRVDPDLHWAGEVVERQVRHMTRLLDDLLDVSRFTRGKITLRKEMTDLAEVVTRAVEATRPAVEGRRQQLAVVPAPEPLYVEADPIRLAQVVGNLLHNATKYTPEEGRIWVTAGREDSEAVLRVRDTGIGIPAEMLGRVFDLFTQVDRPLDRSQGGLGIGLTLVRSLVELHGGSVQATSAGPNQGSEFVVRLPLAPEARSPGDSPKENSPGAPALPRRVLVVDDNVDAAVSFAKLLRLEGHEVSTAHDGPAALEAARTRRPEIVLLDIGLPGMDGYEVARRLREQPATRDLLLVAVTGYGQEGDRQRSQQAGFDYHLVKPVDLDAVEKLLASREPRHAPTV